jgi:hypothetical protein
VQDGVAAMKLNVLRAGGHNNDTNRPDPFDTSEIDRFVAYARAVGAEPILQVPLLVDAAGNPAGPQAGADMVSYANVAQKYGIRYWEIGNEPDLYTDQGDKTADGGAGYTAQSYCTDFAAYVDAMKAVDPTIQILGPELSWKYIPNNDWLSVFLDQCGAKVDIVSVHRYPFDHTGCTIQNAMGDGAAFRSRLRALRATLNGHGKAGAPLAITEANFSYEGDPAMADLPASLGTFYAGMWTADALGIALEEGLWSLAFWSISEGWMTGFFSDQTGQPRPAAYAYELISTHFGPTVLFAKSTPSGLSVYASRDDAGKKTAVLVMNRTSQASSQMLGFEGLDPLPQPYALTLPAYSITLVEMGDDGTSRRFLYTKDMADAGTGPQLQN